MTTQNRPATHLAGVAGEYAAPEPRDEHVEVAGVPLAKLIKRKLVKRPELPMLSQPRSISAEKFRRLKTVLTNDPEQAPQVIVVTSAAPSEGKTLVSTNLALAFASEREANVLLLDADLRRPTVEKWLDPPPKLGLSEILRGKIDLDHAILELENCPLKILPAGTPPRDSVELLASGYARKVIAELRTRFQRIIIDTPPIIPFTDADVLGALSDGVLLVARSGSTLGAMFGQAVNSVTSARILGAVLNDATFSLADRGNYYVDRHYYKYYREGKGK